MSSSNTRNRTRRNATSFAALERGARVVVGTSGLVDDDYVEIDALLRSQHRGVLACGNFTLTVARLQKFAEAAAMLIPRGLDAVLEL